MLKILTERCQGCGLCVEVCPKKILFINKEKVNGRGHTPIEVTDYGKCLRCGLCAIICPDCVIEIKE